MNMPNKFCRIVSVQSRKGGVGKTTFALLLARHCLQAGDIVLFFDLDIAGTAAGIISEAFTRHDYWNDQINCVVTGGGSGMLQQINLVDLFQNYMGSGELPESTWGYTVPLKCSWLNLYQNYMRSGELPESTGGYPAPLKRLWLEAGKINIFSSFLDRCHGPGNTNGHRYGPSTLFDEQHSAWFLDMIKELVQSAYTTHQTALSDTRNLTVIIDNSPGFSGLAPNVDDWLTDLGPERGKFVFVSSLDHQDCSACCEGMKSIHSYFKKKRETAELFRIWANGKKSTKKVQHKPFFNRLAEAVPDDLEQCGQAYAQGKFPAACGQCGLCFYMQENLPSEDDAHKADYLTLLINKIPALAMRNQQETFVKGLLGPDLDWMRHDSVAYSGLLSLQYVSRGLLDFLKDCFADEKKARKFLVAEQEFSDTVETLHLDTFQAGEENWIAANVHVLESYWLLCKEIFSCVSGLSDNKGIAGLIERESNKIFAVIKQSAEMLFAPFSQKVIGADKMDGASVRSYLVLAKDTDIFSQLDMAADNMKEAALSVLFLACLHAYVLVNPENEKRFPSLAQLLWTAVRMFEQQGAGQSREAVNSKIWEAVREIPQLSSAVAPLEKNEMLLLELMENFAVFTTILAGLPQDADLLRKGMEAFWAQQGNDEAQFVIASLLAAGLGQEEHNRQRAAVELAAYTRGDNLNEAPYLDFNNVITKCMENWKWQ